VCWRDEIGCLCNEYVPTQADGQDVVCYYRHPKDVVADMVEDDSMTDQLCGRFEQDSVTDQYGDNHRIFASVSSALWMQHWNLKLKGGNRVMVALRVSGDEFIVTGKRGCHCVIRKTDLFSVMKYFRRNEIKIFRNEFWIFVMKFKICNDHLLFPVMDLYSSVINSNFRNEFKFP